MKRYEVKSLYDPITATVTYLVMDSETRDAIVIDTVLDYDPASSKISTECLEALDALIKSQNVNLKMTLETHAHADHLTGAQELKRRYPSITIAIGERITEVQGIFKKVYNLPERFIPNGKQFDKLLKDGEVLHAGSIEIKVIATPGHTPACVSYLIGDALFTGDALFMPDSGTGRCDFPGGSSTALYESVHERLYKLPENTRVFVGHDYKADGKREAQWESTIAEEKEKNIQLKMETSKEQYTAMRDKRDATLATPRLLAPQHSSQHRCRPFAQEPEDNGVSYLKIPVRKK